jgi:Flp pilus assembly pilin Flp
MGIQHNFSVHFAPRREKVPLVIKPCDAAERRTSQLLLLPKGNTKMALAIKSSIKKKQAGQGMTEYIIIVALIAVAAIAVFQFFGSTIRHQTTAIANEVSGTSSTAETNLAKAEAAKSATEAARVKGMGDFHNDASRGTAP